MLQKPIIGLTSANLSTPDWGDGKFQLDRDGVGRLYCEAIAQAGGLPLMLPLLRTPLGPVEEYFSNCGPGNLHDNAKIYIDYLDGLILSGGDDVGPPPGAPKAELYRQVDRSRDVWESALLAAALEQDKPVLGICRGIQLMNAALGGSNWADLSSERPGQVEHEQKLPRARATHKVNLIRESRLAGIIRFSEILVNSGHHQGVKEVAPALMVAAEAEDGLPEALEHREARFVIGVQWHPEGQLAVDHSRALFKAFIKAAGESNA